MSDISDVVRVSAPVGLEDVKGHLSPLLKMPSEILNEICRLVVASPPRILIVRKRDTQSSQPPVTRTCRELRDIALPIFYGLNSFRLEIDVLTPFQIIDDDFSRTVHNQAFGSWLAGLSSKSTSMLRSIYINLNCGPYCSMLSGVLSENDPDTTTVWTRNEANFKRLGLFLSCNDIGLTLIKNIDHPQLRPLKSELQLLAALTEMWQNLPREMLLCGKRIVSAAAMRNKQTGQSIEAEVSAHVASRDEARAAATNAKNEARYAMEDRWTELASLEPMPDDYDDLHDALVIDTNPLECDASSLWKQSAERARKLKKLAEIEVEEHNESKTRALARAHLSSALKKVHAQLT